MTILDGAESPPRAWKIGRYTFQHEVYPPGALRRSWSCGVRYGPAGPVGAGGRKTPLRAFLGARRFERECVAAKASADA